MTAIRIALAALALLSVSLATAQAPAVTRTDLQRHELSTPGREVVQVRVDIAPGAAFGMHRHPGEEIVYVIEGELEYTIEGRAPVTLRAGEVLFIPDGTPHAARNPGRTNGAELATYIVRKGEKLVELLEPGAAASEVPSLPQSRTVRHMGEPGPAK